jgi:hypothetical protein
VQYVVCENRNFSPRAPIILLSQVDLYWGEFSADSVDALWADTRQMVKDLLLWID